MGSNKTVMVIGAGRGQIPVMDICHKYGFNVVAVSPDGNYPGLKVADQVLDLDVRELDAIVEYARKERISAVVTDQLDEGVVTAAYVAKQLGLNGIATEAAIKFTNKYEMRKAASEAGICVPASFCAKNICEIEEKLSISPELSFPLMMKPVDSAASRGVFKVFSLAEISEKIEYCLSWSKEKKVIIEQFIAGKEYVVDAYTHNHEVCNLIVGHRDYFDIPDSFIPNATVFVDAESASSELENRIKETNTRLVESFGLSFGITHGEYIYDNTSNKIYLVEIAARGGGVFISSDLIPNASGVNANDLLVRDALGLPVEWPVKVKNHAAAYFCYLTPEGEVSKLDGIEKVLQEDGLIKAFFDNIYLGQQTASIKDKSSRKGPILVHGQTKQDCYDVIERVKRDLNIKVKTSKGIEDIIWN